MPLTLLLPDQVSSILLTLNTSHLTASRFLTYHVACHAEHYSTQVYCFESIHFAAHGERHDCVATIEDHLRGGIS